MLESCGYGTDDEERPVHSGPVIARRRSIARTNSSDSTHLVPPHPRAHPGINQEVLARMSRLSTAGDDEDDGEEDEEMLHSYGYNQYSSNNQSKDKRRASTSSCSGKSREPRRYSSTSRGSRTSQRRRSTSSHFKNKDPLHGLYPPKTDDSEAEDYSSSSTEDQLQRHPHQKQQDQHDYEQEFGYESDAGQSTTQSISSSRAARGRRNSVLPGDILNGGVAIEDEQEEEVSLLSSVKSNLEAKKKSTIKPSSTMSTGGTGVEASDNEDSAFLYESQPKPPPQQKVATKLQTKRSTSNKNIPLSSSNDPVEPDTTSRESSWKRKDPLTTSYAVPTVDNLGVSCGVVPVEKRKSKDGWGAMELWNANGEKVLSSDEDASEESYGASMYTKVPIYQELDQYKQKARRRASIDITCMKIPSAEQVDKVIDFKPAEGCSNASDFVVRCFSARLRISGFMVLKHNRSRWSKAKHRVIYLLPDGKTLTWKEAEEDDEEDELLLALKMQYKKQRHPKIDLTTVKEVRHAWSPDPESKKKRGTAVLRSRCKNGGLAGKSFSLVFAKRTLDLTAFSNDQCKVMMEGFSALCFRLKQLKHEQQASNGAGSSREFDEDDWAASTVYGSSSAVTNTTRSVVNTDTSHPQPVSPWGF